MRHGAAFAPGNLVMTRPTTLLAAIGLLTASFAFGAAGAAEIGRTEIGGRTVVIDDNGTWSYADQASGGVSSTPARSGGDCQSIESSVLPVSLCLDEQNWVLGNVEGNAEHNFRRKDGELYLMMITEKDYFPQKTLRDAILINAQNAAGLKKVNVLEEKTVEIGGHSFDRIVYRTTVDNLDVTYDNYYSGIEGKGSVQFVFFSLTEEYQGFKPAIEETSGGFAVNQ